MTEFILQNELTIRISFFIGIFIIMAVWEVRKPCRVLAVSKVMRWSNNVGLVVLNTVLLRLLFPAAALGMAVFAAEQGWGLLNFYALPSWLAFIIAIVVMDLVIWIQHVMVHSIPVLWRLHRVHHADLDFDVTTGSRFHPLEIIISMFIKFATIVLLGPSVFAVLAFEIILNGMAMFNHSNINLPSSVDKILRWLFVTPDMHRIHHSVEDDEANSNFGFNLSVWDRLSGTYRQQPRGGHEGMLIGITDYRDIRQVSRLPGMLALPFKGKITAYVINRRKWQSPNV